MEADAGAYDAHIVLCGYQQVSMRICTHMCRNTCEHAQIGTCIARINFESYLSMY